ncbi:uncharacterized protein BT62DRAFT_996527 [Guyanagaster necrorhizus]|uniref:F-box domain-containing protein n=1 Tax=Guyanagaster necrorhizus TaxID=856835 RepID=A0A9P7VL56_9AGAR|nr:uncharacterized protein BT62DRAFT_996527 [Guyanagaster necrorhizus MCA 3950]KAG7442583.1 hypothetical protein BT62DRAFT_996527 [Guyanagaster necrorhizus MCA 3950]
MNAFGEACPACQHTLTANLDNYERILSANDFSVPDKLGPYINNNFYPASADCIEIQQTLGRLTKNFSCFEELFAHQQNAISQVTFILKKYEEAYAKARSEQLRVQEIIDRHEYALSSPIRSLPDYLLVVIFQLASPNAASVDQFPWIATRVCRCWRDVAHSNPILWSEFRVDVLCIPPPFSRGGPSWFAGRKLDPLSALSMRSEIYKSVLDQALKYSEDAPLTFSFDFEFPTFSPEQTTILGYLDGFIDQAARWRNAKIHIRGPLCEFLTLTKSSFPMLESLDLDVQDNDPSIPADIFASAPNLCNVFLRLAQAEFILPWEQLKELSIFSRSLSKNYYLQILHSGPRLETLRLEMSIRAKSTDDSCAYPVTTLPYLRVLEIDSGMMSFFDSILLPKLVSLKICGDEDNMVPKLTSLIQRSCCNVEKISFYFVFVRAEFTQLFRLLPSLTSLSVNSPCSLNKFFFHEMAQSSLVLPSLTDLSIYRADITYDYVTAIIEMLTARQSCLKQFRLTMNFGTGCWMLDARVGPSGWLASSEEAQLRALSKGGMKIEIGRYESWHSDVSYFDLDADD